jgi:rod shape-determining protein MreC
MQKRRRNRRRRNKKTISILPKHIFFLLLFLTVAIVFVSYRFPNLLLPVRNGVETVIIPMQKGINVVGRSVSDKLELLSNLKNLQAENEELKAQVAALTSENQLISQEKYELAGLQELYELDKKYPNYEKVAARIIARESNGWYNVFTIDKGYEDGIKENMNVMAGNGLVGIVISVRKNSATIRSIIDDSSKVSGMFLKTSDTCIVSGDLNSMISDGRIKVSMIPLDADINESDEVVTSHISDKFQQGILIGYVTEIRVDSSNMTKTAYLTPVVDFEHLDEVLIIKELKESFELDEK